MTRESPTPQETSPFSPVGTVCAVIVTYHPRTEEFRETLSRTASQVDHLVVVDNTPGPEESREVQRVVEGARARVGEATGADDVTFIRMGGNAGLARAYNAGVRAARGLNVRFVLFLDQDSHLLPGAVASSLRKYVEVEPLLPVGAVCCQNVELVQVSLPVDLLLSRVKAKRAAKSEMRIERTRIEGLVEISLFTNSGTIVPLANLERVGPFNERLFLDSIDYDYSLRLSRAGFRLFEVVGAHVLHHQGRPLTRRILVWAVELRTYPALRSFYIVRDTLVFARQWFRRYPRVVSGILGSMMLSTVGAILFLPDRHERVQLILRALAGGA